MPAAMSAMDYVFQGIDDERNGRAQWVYSLWEIYQRLLDLPSTQDRISLRRSLLNDVSTKRNIDPDRIQKYLRVPERIPLEILEEQFPRTADGEPTWHLHLTWTHLEKAAQAGGQRFGPVERVQWLAAAADQEMSSGQFPEWLRQNGVIKPRADRGPLTPEEGEQEVDYLGRLQLAVSIVREALSGSQGKRAKTKAMKFWREAEGVLIGSAPAPTTAAMLMERMAEEIRRCGQDVDLSRHLARRLQNPNPANVGVLLEWLTGVIRQQRPDALVQLSAGGSMSKAETESA